MAEERQGYSSRSYRQVAKRKILLKGTDFWAKCESGNH
jgi:hypothetical protein